MLHAHCKAYLYLETAVASNTYVYSYLVLITRMLQHTYNWECLSLAIRTVDLQVWGRGGQVAYCGISVSSMKRKRNTETLTKQKRRGSPRRSRLRLGPPGI